ncbi:class I SAM-dependent methyltransferase [Devosia rhizoryzae]|uniref:class I SAM-dependent methyltransferase n=1 Tax=Devosia rhizoryzae TaxID=2774137 RepID=UPI002D7E1887|nr:class I SAM-dependent methyltransferase [Devosia rhizoryzae]
MDLSAAALEMTRTHLGSLADQVDWIVADAGDWTPSKKYAVWHDRAAFHFLTEPAQRQGYMDRLRAAIDPGGHVIIGTFALDGPEKCSGLPVARHDADSLTDTLGDDFKLIDTRWHDHLTPWSTSQKFQFSTFVRRPSAP